MSIITGFLFGLSTLLFVGPVLFYLLKSTIESGFKAGVAVSLGILLGDAIYVALALFGTESLINQLEYQKNKKIISLLEVILLTIGLKYVLKPNVNTEVNGKLQKQKIHCLFCKWVLDQVCESFSICSLVRFAATVTFSSCFTYCYTACNISDRHS